MCKIEEAIKVQLDIHWKPGQQGNHQDFPGQEDVARQLGVCTSAIAKAIQHVEGAANKC